ncbi:MAG: hypothetical protein ACFFD4_25740 [Candidatus Odinarchaeota archaeon]
MKKKAKKRANEEKQIDSNDHQQSGTPTRNREDYTIETHQPTVNAAELAKEKHGMILETFNGSFFIAEVLQELELLMLLLRAILTLTEGEISVKEHDVLAPLYSRLKIINKEMETRNLVSKVFQNPDDLEILNKFFFMDSESKKKAFVPYQYL